MGIWYGTMLKMRLPGLRSRADCELLLLLLLLILFGSWSRNIDAGWPRMGLSGDLLDERMTPSDYAFSIRGS